MSKRDEKLKESFNFISKNFDITFDKIPNYLIELWYSDPHSSDEDHKDFSWTVFMYIIVLLKKRQGVSEFLLDEARLSKLFGNWQVALALAELNAITDIKIEPFKIFDIENLENLMVGISTKSYL
jgi:hypothetical protein